MSAVRRMIRTTGDSIASVLLFLIRAYQRYVSPGLPPRCRFTPSCSAYAADAIERFGLARGAYLAVRRLLRCHPWHRGGHDPVPPRVAKTDDLVRHEEVVRPSSALSTPTSVVASPRIITRRARRSAA